MSCVSLNDANLQGANLTRVVWKRKEEQEEAKGKELELGEDFIRARGANFTAVDLTGADLSMADLTGAMLNHADLTRCNLKDAVLTNAQLFHCDVEQAVGLSMNSILQLRENNQT